MFAMFALFVIFGVSVFNVCNVKFNWFFAKFAEFALFVVWCWKTNKKNSVINGESDSDALDWLDEELSDPNYYDSDSLMNCD